MTRLGKQTLSVWHLYYVLSLDDFVYVALVNSGNRTPKHFVSAHFHAMMDPDPVKWPSAREGEKSRLTLGQRRWPRTDGAAAAAVRQRRLRRSWHRGAPSSGSRSARSDGRGVGG
jgi:hypothetical protein